VDDTWMRNRKAAWPGESLVAGRFGWSRLCESLRDCCVDETASCRWSDSDDQLLESSIPLSRGRIALQALKLAGVYSVRLV
jgi:hypothetical protein